ncbi:MAG: hypothetical protein PHT40_00620 [Patescibacteria group bacterium]|nr:hypothetical protein [Patescibacteria group bacterium]
MSKYFSFCNDKQKRLNMGKKTRRAKCLNLNLTSRLFLLGLVCFGVFAYVLTVNNGSVKGFEISRLESQLNELQLQNQKLTDQVQATKSLSTLEDKVKTLQMVAVSNIEYLDVSGPVAMAK